LSINRYNTRRDANESEIINAFKKFGASVEKIDTPCDLLVGFNHCNYLIEIKTKSGKLTKKQREFIENWRGSYEIIRSIDDVITFFQNES